MRLRLQNGYPFPYPKGLTEDQQYEISEAARGHFMELDGVAGLEWLDTLTIEFETEAAFDAAKEATSWGRWCDSVLEAQLSAEDGYGHPAVVVNNMAYCGILLYTPTD